MENYLGVFILGVLVSIVLTILITKNKFFKMQDENGQKMKGKHSIIVGIWFFCPFIYGETIIGIIGLILIIIGTSSAFNWYNKTVKKQHRENSLLQGENLIITKKFENSKQVRKFFTVLASIVGIILTIFNVDVLLYDFSNTSSNNYISNILNSLINFISIPLSFVLIITIGNFIIKLLENIELTLTDMRVFGYNTLGKRIDLPIDSISAVGINKLFKSIILTTASGSIKFSFLYEYRKFHSEINKLILNRQVKFTTAPQQVKNVTKESNADELKKYKDLLDTGAITEEEYNAKKKELLGL